MRTPPALHLGLALAVLGALAPRPADAQTPVLTKAVQADRVPFDAQDVCQSGSVKYMKPRSLQVMAGTYDFQTLDLGGGEAPGGDLWAQFNYPKEIVLPGGIGTDGFSVIQDGVENMMFMLRVDKDKLAMKNFLGFSVGIADEPYDLYSPAYCVNYVGQGLYFRGATRFDGAVEAKILRGMIILVLPGIPPKITIECINPFSSCYDSDLPKMGPQLIMGRGLPVAHWVAADPAEAAARANAIYLKPRWIPRSDGGTPIAADGDGKDAFPFTSYDIEAVGGVKLSIERTKTQRCANGVCVDVVADAYMITRYLDGAITRRFYNDPRLGFASHYPGGTLFQAFFTAGDRLPAVSGPLDPGCLDTSLACIKRAQMTPRFIAALETMKALCGDYQPCGGRYPRPDSAINAEVVIAGTDDSLRLANWCRLHQNVACMDSTANPLDGRDRLVKKDSLDRVAQAARARGAAGYLPGDSVGTNRIRAGTRGAGAPVMASEAERVCRQRASADSTAYINGPIPDGVDRRTRQFNADSAFRACQSAQVKGTGGGAPPKKP